MRNNIVVALASCVLFSGCSTVPSEVRTSAEETGAWIGRLESDLNTYRSNMAAADDMLRQAIQGAQETAAVLSSNYAELLRVSQAAGDTRTLELVGRLKTVIDGASKDPTELEFKLKQIDEHFAGLLKPASDVQPAFGEARAAVRQLGQPLPDSVRLKELKNIFKKVKEDTAENRKALP